MWNDPAGTGGDWSTTNEWLFNGALPAAGTFPGLKAGDMVSFASPGAGSCTLDVGLRNPLASLSILDWGKTLALTHNLSVANGSFTLADASTISLGPGFNLTLTDLSALSTWSAGTITGGGGSTFNLDGSTLYTGTGTVSGTPADLGTNMTIEQSTKNSAAFVLSNMTNNLPLTDTDTYIDVGNGGTLVLSQHIAAAANNNAQGGIAFGPAHAANSPAIQVEVGGSLVRSDTPTQGVPDSVSIAGAVHNAGGAVTVTQAQLTISGADANGYSYWQELAGTPVLTVGAGANISAPAGTYQIDFGPVDLTATSGASTDMLDGKGLNFGNGVTSLNIADSQAGTPGTIIVQGSVTLAANTTTLMNCNSATNTADLLEDNTGTITLAGTLNLTITGAQAPNAPLTFFQDGGPGAKIAGAFVSIVDSLNDKNDTGAVGVNGAGNPIFQVTFKK